MGCGDSRAYSIGNGRRALGAASLRAMNLIELVETSRAVAATRSRKDKIERLAACILRLAPDERATGVAWLSGELPQGRVGVGWAMLSEARAQAVPEGPSLSVAETDRAIDEIAQAGGRSGARRRALGALLARATESEREFLIPLLGGELRQGALEGIVVEAVAAAANLPAGDVRRAFMLAGSLGVVAQAALAEGQAGLARFALTPLHPVLPMLAQPAEDLGEALDSLGDAALEYKIDGARVQAHRAGGIVRVFSRGLHDVTAAVPEIVEAVSALPGGDLILDGEAIAIAGDRPLPFQTTMRRFGRKLDVDALRAELPLDVFFFDVLHADGQTLIDRPGRERVDVLEALVPAARRMPRRVTSDPREAEDFFREAIARGHEGIMAKSLAASYEAGSRGAAWLKLKPAHTLDLVVLAAEWGSGRRRGWLSNLHLGARATDGSGGFVMLGKTFKGMTDEILRWQTEQLLAREIGREAHVVHVRPELVVEIAFNDVQASPQYPGGVALRFARVKRYRPDKSAQEADTIDAVRAIHLRSLGREEAREG